MYSALEYQYVIYGLFGLLTLVSWLVQKSLEQKFKKFSQQPLPLTGRQVAEKMLRDNGIFDVEVVSVQGQLTDHYNPADKTVNLSDAVFEQANVAAAAVAAHECGHAVQHQKEYAPLRLRSALVPAVSFSSKYMPWILLAGVLLVNLSVIPLGVGIALFAVTTLFSLVTLPVEIDASRRAVLWLEQAGITNAETTPMAKSALRSAAYTYVVAALSSLATLLYYVVLLLGRRK
ncbi:MAG: zinc metallopeptidase [Paludibacteraceae bacterium]|nr:zinc metallopeptidase [Paludibacteraceae bacterium]